MKNRRLIVRLLSLLIFMGCAVYVGYYFLGISNDNAEMSHIQDIVYQEEEKTAAEHPQENEEKEAITYAENGMISKYYPLYQQNNDMTGWLKVDGTNIDYPVMYVNDGNEFYLKRGFDKKKNASGMLFMDYECNFNDSDNLIIYGHNMRSGTMLAQLLKYKNKSFFDENGYISFDSLYHTGRYRVIGAFYATKKENFRYYEFVKASGEDEYDSYVTRVKELSLYETNENAVYGEKLLTLSTCSYNSSDERFVVVAKKVE
ncbi:MAG: class B sortase [bacterium]|nr:class B sortase [bacterium]